MIYSGFQNGKYVTLIYYFSTNSYLKFFYFVVVKMKPKSDTGLPAKSVILPV